MHRDLYMQALKRISELELDGNSLQNLMECMQDVRMTMVRSKLCICTLLSSVVRFLVWILDLLVINLACFLTVLGSSPVELLQC